MRVLLSIKPKFAEKILNWKKLYELRKIFTKKEITKVIIYESAPISRVVWEFEVEKVLYEPITQLWDHTKDFSQVNKEFFDSYFKWKEFWYAIKLKNPRKYRNLKLLSDYWIKFPPQNYCFI